MHFSTRLWYISNVPEYSTNKESDRSPVKVKRSPPIPTNLVRNNPMLTVNQSPLKSALTFDSTPQGTVVYLGSENLGLVETYPAWGVHHSELPEGVALDADVYVALNRVYKHSKDAVAAIVADWLVSGNEAFPEYI